MVKISNVVVIGGGTGSSIVLRGLKKYDCNLYAIVPMGDSGGSTAKLREEFGVLSAGEIRQRIIALADDNLSKELVELLDYRFENGTELKGHTLGNILIAGLTELYGSQEKALEALSKMARIKGKIIPSTWDRFDLAAEYNNGKKIIGEHFIDEAIENSRIVNLYTQPKVEANPQAIEAIRNSDVIIFGPGDLYTSILHNLVVDGISKAIKESRARKIFICNLMTSEETIGMSLQDLIDELEKYIGEKTIEFVVINSKPLPFEIVKRYENNNQFPVKLVLNEETRKRVKLFEADILADEIFTKDKSDALQRSILRHNPDKLGTLLIDLVQR